MFVNNKPDTWPLLLTLKQVQAITGFGKGKALNLIKSRELPMVKLRGSYIINRDTMINWLQQFEGKGSGRRKNVKNE